LGGGGEENLAGRGSLKNLPEKKKALKRGHDSITRPLNVVKPRPLKEKNRRGNSFREKSPGFQNEKLLKDPVGKGHGGGKKKALTRGRV